MRVEMWMGNWSQTESETEVFFAFSFPFSSFSSSCLCVCWDGSASINMRLLPMLCHCWVQNFYVGCSTHLFLLSLKHCTLVAASMMPQCSPVYPVSPATSVFPQSPVSRWKNCCNSSFVLSATKFLFIAKSQHDPKKDFLAAYSRCLCLCPSRLSLCFRSCLKFLERTN